LGIVKLLLGKKEEGARIGIIVSIDNFSGGRNYGLKLAYNVQNNILRKGYETEIITLPTLCDNYKEFTSENNLINIYKEQVASMLELILSEKSYDGLVLMPKGLSSKMGMIKAAIRQNLPTIVFGEGPSSISNGGCSLKDLTLLAGSVAKGKTSAFEFQEKEETQIEYVGEGVDFGSSNILNVILEVLGLSIFGSSTTFASTIARENLAKEVAETIVKQFPSTSINSIETSIKSYKSINAWKSDLQATEQSFDTLQNIMQNSGELDEKVAFSKLVNNTFAKKVFG
jgi:dihydroxyacid dehydratase/phosphogluconate dehydratase